MKLYLVRHGDAVSDANDAHRRLSERGRGDVRRLAAFLKPLGVRVGAVWHSELVRAAETAAAIAPAVRSREGVSEQPDLLPESSVTEMAERIGDYGEPLMLVGHEPFLSTLAAKLVNGKKSQAVVDMRKGAVLCLSRGGAGAWTVSWMVLPELLPE